MIRLHREGSDPEEITERDARLLIANNHREVDWQTLLNPWRQGYL